MDGMEGRPMYPGNESWDVLSNIIYICIAANNAAGVGGQGEWKTVGRSVLGVDEKEAEEEVEAGKWVLCVSSYILLVRFVANKLKVEIVGVN